jgi:DNA-binding XRE family transcriptional regulator
MSIFLTKSPTALRRAKDVREPEIYPPQGSLPEWRKDREHVAAYDAPEDEFAVASALIKTRGDADMKQAGVAEAMGTTQAAVARLESGKTMPSTRTLERFAQATTPACG